MRHSAFAIFTLMWVIYFDVEAQVDTEVGYIYKLPVTQVYLILKCNSFQSVTSSQRPIPIHGAIDITSLYLS